MSSKNTYRLINPFIEGSLNTVVRAKNSLNASIMLYGNLSNHFTNHVDNFYITVQNLQNKRLYNFLIDEKRLTGDEVDFSITRLRTPLSKDLEENFLKEIQEIDPQTQTGGKHRKHHNRHKLSALLDNDRHSNIDDSSDSSDSSSESDDSDFYRHKYTVQPIQRFTYFHLPYYNLVNLSTIDSARLVLNPARLFMPMFNLPINPTLEIRFDLYNYNV